MKNLNPIQTRGYFWLAGNPEKQLPGELRISENGHIELDLIGVFANPELKERMPIEELFGHIDNVDRICGHVDTEGCVTLFDCLSTNVKSNLFSTQGSGYSTFYAHRALIGAAYEEDDLSFSEFDFVVEGLDDWLQTDTIRTKIEVGVENDIIKSFKGGTIEFESRESRTYNLNDGIKLQFISLVGPSSLSSHLPLTSVTLTSKPHISLVSEKPRDIDYFLTLAAKIQRFIALAVDQEVQMQSFTFYNRRSDRPKPVRLYLQMNAVPNDEYKPELLKVLFALPQIEDDFEEMLNRWVEYYESDAVGHALNLYFAGAWKEGSFLESNFMFLAQAIEVLNRELCPTKKPMSKTQFKKIR